MKRIFFCLFFFLNLKSSEDIQFQLPTQNELQSLFIKNGYSFFAQESSLTSLFADIKIAPTLPVDTKVFAKLFTKSADSHLIADEEIFFPFNNDKIIMHRTYFIKTIKLLLPYLKYGKNHLFFDIPEKSIQAIFHQSSIDICSELGGKILSIDKIKSILSSSFIPYNVINFFKRTKPITKDEEYFLLSKIIESSNPKIKASL